MFKHANISNKSELIFKEIDVLHIYVSEQAHKNHF